jgi:hypothetical protein
MPPLSILIKSLELRMNEMHCPRPILSELNMNLKLPREILAYDSLNILGLKELTSKALILSCGSQDVELFCGYLLLYRTINVMKWPI